MKIKTLRLKHPEYDCARWDELDALSKGGKCFHRKIADFLPQNAVEPPQIYAQRISQAHYHSYTAAITSLYVGWLFAADFQIKPRTRGTSEAIANPDKFYGMFMEDVGDENTLSDFCRERFREVLTTGKSYWVAELPSNQGVAPADREDWEKRGLGEAGLKALPRDSVLDWETDSDGDSFKWVSVHTKDKRRDSWASARDMVVETWRIYDDVNVTEFVLSYDESKPPSDEDEAPEPSVAPHGFKRVPVLTMCVPEELCIGEQTRDPQLEHFRLDNALSWLIRRTCYSQPVFNLADGDTVPTMGAGYAIVLGQEDKFGWTSPPVAPFDVLQKNVEAKRDEIFRVTHTMAQSVDNNAETVGRSADSKEIDAAATRIMLQAYAAYVAKSIEETYETISEARGDADYEWSVEGFSGYDTATVASLISNAMNARLLGIPSQTFHRELSNKVASALFAGEADYVKNKIRFEIDSATFDISPDSPETEMLRAKAADLRAKAEAESIKADATKLKADASMITAKKPSPKPAAGQLGKR